MIGKIKDRLLCGLDALITGLLAVVGSCLFAALIVFGLIGHTIEKRLEKKHG